MRKRWKYWLTLSKLSTLLLSWGRVSQRLSAKVAISLIPTLKNTGVTWNDRAEGVDNGSKEWTASGTGSKTVMADLEPTTLGIIWVFLNYERKKT